jgi:hypothetical protein
VNHFIEPKAATEMTLAQLEHISLQLLLALVLGAVLAYRPWRYVMKRPPVPTETAQAQTLIAVAGAILVTMIGDSVARAFGLVGLGGFIRFRSGIKDPRDAAVMFVSIGIGMACGMGLEGIAALTAVFVSVVLVLFDLSTTPKRARVRVSIDDAPGAMIALAETFPSLRVVTYPVNGVRPHDLVIEVDAPETADAQQLQATIRKNGVTGIHAVEVLDD